ncbi:MAG: hypothetical protein UHD64_01555, partial [Bacteroidales bacterium]|nr:hypothetical protein [Bacteroidales bacterium]
GNTIQDGTPAPDTPIPIKVVTGEQNVEIHNKNLFDKDNDVTLKTQATFNGKEDNEFTTSTSNIRTLVIIRVPSNSGITLSINNDNYIQSRYFICQLKTPTIEAGKNERWYPGNSTIVTTDKTNYLGIVLEIKKNGTTVNSTQEAIDEMNFQIEEGTIATSYIPYQSQTYPLSLGDIELCKIKNYKDYIFKNVVGSPYYNANLDLNGWYLKNYYDIHTINNTDISLISSYWYDSTGCYGAGMLKSLLNLPNKILDKKSLCDISKKISENIKIAENTYSFVANADYIFFFSSSFDTLENAKGILVGAKIMYELATPTNTKITDTTLIQQLENINNNAHSYKDTTIIECTSASTDNEVIGFSGDIKVTSVGLGNSLNTSLLSSNLQEETNIDDIQEEPNLDDVNEIEEIEEPIEEKVS